MRNPFTLALDLLFPRRCVSCGREGSWGCVRCVGETVAISQPFTREREVGLLPFQNRLVREGLHHLKYNGIFEIAELFGQVVREAIASEWLRQHFGGSFVLIPVPISQAKQKQRGYNQAELLAIVLGRWLEVPVWTGALQRQARRQTQVGQNAQTRAAQVAKAFSWRGAEVPAWAAQPWVVVDDLRTTGSTLEACIRALQPHSLRPVSALTLAYK